MGDRDRGRDGSRNDDGRWSPQFTDGEFLAAVASLPVASTQRVADEVGCSYDLAYRRLKELADDGRINNEMVGGSFVWLDPDGG
jgi:hypothetical protein